ncbi:transcriptional regulator [Aliihoeflea aestuarii]|uniref:putative glycolipid-binding domain-containing protein n=1 Tax=Aliihoeflea aestuarii TaxID=453840 RepID=UPI002091EB15|nr:putative glycolipid-binding domain-containing protein [Aliihoeflea aestuarii]MCO6391197.1 transcriptional regulator [Aliihoeflea aestuarii]
MFRALATRTIRWRPLEGAGLEHLTLSPKGDGVTATSVVIGDFEGRTFGARYTIECDAGWAVRAFRIQTTDGRSLAMTGDGAGNWRDASGASRPEFDGCIDIDLSVTPFTNTLPIRRLALGRDAESVRLSMIYVPFDTLEPFVDGQNYTCLEESRLYRYEAADRTFAADLPLDEDGLVLDYPTLFARL